MSDAFDPDLVVAPRVPSGAVGGPNGGGAAGGVQIRISGRDWFSDDGQTVDTDGRPNPRHISNTVFKQTDSGGALIDKPNAGGFSSLLWVWGQFLDHDLDQTGTDRNDTADIPIPAGDPMLQQGITSLGFNRSDPMSGTGSGGVAREYANEITSFIDASMVYGSSQSKLTALLEPGSAKLLLSETDTILFGTGISPFGQGFVAGDTRAGENIALTSMHALFAREHNRIVDLIEAADTTLTTTQVFDAARARVEAIVQAITYNEFLPILIGENALDAYDGHDSTVNPAISLEFSTAIFRLGHTLLSPTIARMNEDGSTHALGNIALRDAFQVRGVVEQTGIDAILRGMSTTMSQELDTFLVEDVRSFLFSTGQGLFGSDLAALNIQRGRDHGLPSYLEMRGALGLAPVTTFEQISSDPDVVMKLRLAYGDDLSKVDLWVGGLAEDSVAGGMVGETFRAVLIDQFTRLRDGDPLWALIRNFSPAERDELWSTTLSDVIKRNTTVVDLQDDAFVAYLRHAGDAGADEIVGTAGQRNLIIGNGGDDTLIGADGDDHLVGGDGVDRLEGRGGSNVLVGGADGDVYVFDVTTPSYNVIRGWQSIDAFEFQNTAGVPRATLTEGPEGTTITFGETVILVEGVAAADLPFGPNEPPETDPDVASAPQNGFVVIDVLANDFDPDGLDATSVRLEAADAGTDGRLKTVAGQGVWSVNPTTGAITFTPETGYAGPVTPVAYTVRDSEGLASAPTEVSVTIVPGSPPTAAPDAAEVEVNGSVIIDVLGNDTDDGLIDPGSIRLEDADPESGGLVKTVGGQGTWTVDVVDGVIVFEPEADYAGTVTPVAYTVADTVGLRSTPATVSVTILPANAPPLANPDAAEVAANGSVTIDVLGNDQDPDGALDPTSVLLVDANINSNGRVKTVPGEGEWRVNAATGAVTFTPEPGYAGPVTAVGYTVADTEGARSTAAAISVTITGGNSAPVAQPDAGSVAVNGSGAIAVLANDFDDGALDPTSVQLVDADPGSNGRIKTVAGQGAWSVNATTGVVTFAAVTNFTGPVTAAAYTVADTTGLRSAPAPVDVTLTGGLNPGQTRTGNANNNSLSGAGGNDTINGNGGNDTLVGNGGNDTLNGGAGVDAVSGGSGNDVILISGNEAQTDTMNGGGGLADTIRVVAAGGAVTLAGTGRITNVEILEGSGQAVLGTTGADALDFSIFAAVAGVASINGLDGNDVITGSRGADVLQGGLGDDTLNGAGGDDILDGGAGGDVVDGGDGDDVILIRGSEAVTDTMRGGDGDGDVIRIDPSGGDAVLNGTVRITGVEIFDGSGARLMGTSGADVFDFSGFTAVTGVSSIRGGGGADTIIGGPGADSILGGGGNDVIDGRGGNNRMNGGPGNDTFVFVAERSNGVNTIDGFDADGNDVIRLVGFAGLQGLSDAQRLAAVGEATVFTAQGGTIDLAELGGAGEIRLNGVTAATLNFASEDFVFA
jgi:CshA-type fibril repeat protein